VLLQLLAAAPSKEAAIEPAGNGYGQNSYWAAVKGRPTPPGQTRTYYIQAEEVKWDYIPLKRNGISDHQLIPPEKVSLY
jgi:hypothetical protein